MHLLLPPPLGMPGIPEVMPEPRNSGKRLVDWLVASNHRDNTSEGFTGTKSPSPNLAIDGEEDSFFLCLNRAELKTTGILKTQIWERHGNPVTTSSRAGIALYSYSLKPISSFTCRKHAACAGEAPGTSPWGGSRIQRKV